jgi:hypothetical protein
MAMAAMISADDPGVTGSIPYYVYLYYELV